MINNCVFFSFPGQRDPKYYETSRNGKRKRIYEAVKPIHHFHLEYQLTPGPQSPVYQTDVVTYDIVAKVFSEHDERVVNVWQDKGLNYYGWKHRLVDTPQRIERVGLLVRVTKITQEITIYKKCSYNLFISIYYIAIFYSNKMFCRCLIVYNFVVAIS